MQVEGDVARHLLLSVASITLMFRLFVVVAAAEDPIILLGRHGSTGVATLLDVLGEPVERLVQPIAPLVVVLLLFLFAVLVVQMTVMTSIFVIFLTVFLI